MNEKKPLKKHLDYLDRELGVFMHYGIRTFNEEHRDWDMKPMSAASFDPSKQDCRAWIRELKAAGVKYTVLTSKHHDGFALWQSNETEYCMKNAAYKNGKGDVVKEYVDACREYGMFCGIYYSCAQFDTEERQGSEYDDFVVNQLTELLTNYGKIDLLWFDGCGSERHEFDNERITNTIRSLQPEIFCFGSWGRDARWIGNEWGAAPLNNPNTADIHDLFLPAECDCCITRNQSENFWFYNETHKACVRTPEEMLGLYYHTIGRGSNLLLNIAPDRRGLLPEENVKLLSDMTKEMHRRLVDCRIPCSEIKSDSEKIWVTLDKYSLVDHVVIEENIENGEHIKEFDVCIGETFEEFNSVQVYHGYTVGHKAICTFPPIRAKNVIIKIKGDGKQKIKALYACYVSSDKQITQIY